MTHRAELRPDVTRNVDGYSVDISYAPEHPQWDEYLRTASSRNVLPQTSHWGRARAAIGWSVARCVVSEQGRIVGGLQLLTRPMPYGGNVGFVCRGPVVDCGHLGLEKRVVDAMLDLGRARGARYLVVQTPRASDKVGLTLEESGFRGGAFDLDVTATVRIDLTRELRALAADLSAPCREKIAAAEQAGFTARRGTRSDLPTFNGLRYEQCLRAGCSSHPDHYYDALWGALRPYGHIELFIAELHGEPVSALLAAPFGSDCYHMERAWSGRFGEIGPNEFLEWEVIKWAKCTGHAFSDLDGIERSIANRLLKEGAVSVDHASPETALKVGFGGQIVVDPYSYHYLFSPALRFAYRCVPTSVLRSQRINAVFRRLQDGSRASTEPKETSLQ